MSYGHREMHFGRFDNMTKLQLSDKTVFLTGATGFIGSHLLKRLIKEGCNVHISIRKNSSLWRIEEFKNNFTVHDIDLTDSNDVSTLLQQIRPDVLFHLAAYGVDYFQQDIHQAIDINVKASVNLFDAFDGQKFIHTGTCLEYGHNKTPVSECNILLPNDMYGATKASSVCILNGMAKNAKCDNLIILRPFIVFGKNESMKKFLPHLINKLKHKHIVKMTPGEQVRDYVYVDDLVDAYILAATVPLKNKVEIINIGSGKGISLKNISLIVSEQLDTDKNLLHFGVLSYRLNETMYLVTKIDKAKTLLGWDPKISIEKGIEKILQE